MSLTGFLFGNVDEEGNLSDNELADELRDTLGGDDTSGDYLSSMLGSGLFSDSADKGKVIDRAQTLTPHTDTNSDIGAAAADGGDLTPLHGSSEIKPAQDAIDYSDFNELADDAVLSSRWNHQEIPLSSGLKYGAQVERAQVDDDYDEDEEEEDRGIESADLATTTGSVPSSYVAQQSEEPEYLESDEESLEDLFDSPEKTKPAARSTDAIAADLESDSAKVQYLDELTATKTVANEPQKVPQ
ncbi:hypothetical protein FB639_004092, partial [Coemansia asiatica]